jgi:hypothetical protein
VEYPAGIADGFVDQRYLNEVPSSPLEVGQRLTMSEAFCREAIEDTRRLCQELAALHAVP